MESKSFEPFIYKDCKLLILGTMPGKISLEKQQYYAHDRNAFWPILFKIFDQTYSTNYRMRINLLRENKIALWDTLKFCFREGSLDSNIQLAEPNNIPQLLNQFPKIKSVVFNGQYAEKFYKKNHSVIPGIQYLVLPSTSPANARLSFEQKLNKWTILREIL